MNDSGRLSAVIFSDRLKTRQFLIMCLLLGMIVRIGLMPFTMHVDPRFTGDMAAIPYIVQKWNSPDGNTGNLLYPPLLYYTLSAYLLGLPSPLTRELWDKPISGPEAQYNWIASPYVFRNLFVLKAWYLLPEIGIAFLLWSMYRRQLVKARTALLIWVFSPLVLYDAYFHGQFDLVPVFFVVLSLWFAYKEHPVWAAFMMGIGACFKTYPLFFLLPMALILVQDWRDRLKMLLAGGLPYLLFMIPLVNNYYSLGNYFSENFLAASYDLGFGAQVYFFIAFYAVILWYLHFRQASSFEDLWRVCLAILLVYYQFSYFDLHYWAWIVPFAVIYWVEHPAEARPFYLVIGLCLLVLLAPTPLARYLAPISPRFFLRLPSLMELLNPYLPMLFITNVVRSLLAGTCFYLAWRLLRGMPSTQPKVALADLQESA